MKEIQKNNQYFIEYQKIRDETLRFYRTFKENYRNFMCQKGCTDCCESFSILPVEFYWIREMRRDENPINQGKNSTKCKFLINGLCQIYNLRPIMCITQGLPLLIGGEEGQSKEIIICRKNKNIIPKNRNNRYKLFEYDILIGKMIVLNELFCQEFRINTERIDIEDIGFL
ncbi:MAG: YkgJ family cysteine cluster protein [Myxococcota bacterium]